MGSDLEALALAALYAAGVTLAFAGNRTMLHVGMGNLAWFALLFDDPRWVLGGALLLLVGAVLAHVRRPRLYDDVLAGERDLGPVTFFGAFAGVALLVAVLALPLWWGVYGLLCMAFADPAGFYVGRAWGRHRLPNGKSIEGFGAVALACVPVALLVEGTLGSPLPAARLALEVGLVSLGAALGEALAPRHLDNLLMPFAALGALALARALLG